MPGRHPHQPFLPHLNPPAIAPPVAHDPDLAETLGRSFMTLSRFPDLSSQDICRHAPEIGNAGEAHVASWSARRGLHPVPAPAGAQFDHIFAVGRNLLRIQTKTTAGLGRDGHYHFRMTRGNSGDPHGTCRYEQDAYDIAALVFLDRGVVLFTREKKSSFSFSVADVELIGQIELHCFCDCLLGLGILSQRQFEDLLPDENSPTCG